jgi:ABC-type nitrate/sulfonate/bicarbonate transport system substrate-binding protein
MCDNKRHVFLIALCFIALAVILCSGTGCEPEKQTGLPEKIIIAYTTSVSDALVHIAFTKNYFAEEGLDAIPQRHATGKLALQSVLEGKADLASAADTPIMFAAMNGKKMSILATIETSDKNECILVRQDRGIMKPSDLKGKRIGLTRGTAGDFFGESFLAAEDINRKQVTIVNMSPDEMSAALGTGRVDAVSIWNPFLIQLKKESGAKARIFCDETVYTETLNIVAGRDFVGQHPEAVRRVLRALVRAETFASERPEEARRLVAEFIKADKAILDEVWNIFNFHVTLDQSLLMSLEDQSKWAMKQRLTKHTDMPNYLDFIYVEGLRAVKPGAVRIIR